MGIMTRAQMQAEVAGSLNRSDLNTLIDRWLYRAVLDLSTYRKFFENETSTTMTQASGAATATWPADILSPVRLEWSDGSVYYNCAVKDLIYVRELYHSGATGRPDYVARFGALGAYFDRVADQTYAWTVYYKFRPADFADDAALSPLNGEWDQALILWAGAEGFRKLRQWDLMATYKKDYYSYVRGRLGDVEEIEEAYNESFAGDIDDDPFSY